jgi:hypothetical protein
LGALTLVGLDGNSPTEVGAPSCGELGVRGRRRAFGRWCRW